ncbi:Hypothetical_protein [Hexamita inflata]|uniref:Hypothetical_protein n=1 Tax=Hexamita inflata TaxID=28002 RepID=A0AA86P3U2_9EUKA|nr:Hypothetical protein HINF_LOCUS18474 [Hexamita inflata]CAI9930833.1 Hypothetical protein HINF_LOCUS18478 [Hexamita inflata]CAI9930840.1 Hypothetical protein HINF_LOCUS18485 [Hexamita inflata]CAI9969662.1 Hypothetical protein HINF_LOCUS57307 [Hexamita inflata]
MSLIFQTTFQNVYYLIIYIQIITKSACLIFLPQRTGQKTQRKTVTTTLVSLTTLADVYYRTCNYSHQPGSREGGVSHNYAISESHSSCVNSGLAKRPLLRSRIISGRDFCKWHRCRLHRMQELRGPCYIYPQIGPLWKGGWKTYIQLFSSRNQLH